MLRSSKKQSIRYYIDSKYTGISSKGLFHLFASGRHLVNAGRRIERYAKLALFWYLDHFEMTPLSESSLLPWY
jgi:hypothetical protein